MDEVIFEEFKGTGNMELILDRKLAERRLFLQLTLRGQELDTKKNFIHLKSLKPFGNSEEP